MYHLLFSYLWFFSSHFKKVSDYCSEVELFHSSQLKHVHEARTTPVATLPPFDVPLSSTSNTMAIATGGIAMATSTSSIVLLETYQAIALCIPGIKSRFQNYW